MNNNTNGGPLRARCDACGHRFPWPPDAPPTPIEPLVRPEIACPACYRVSPLTEEPNDEAWWDHITEVGDDELQPVARRGSGYAHRAVPPRHHRVGRVSVG